MHVHAHMCADNWLSHTSSTPATDLPSSPQRHNVVYYRHVKT